MDERDFETRAAQALSAIEQALEAADVLLHREVGKLLASLMVWVYGAITWITAAAAA